MNLFDMPNENQLIPVGSVIQFRENIERWLGERVVEGVCQIQAIVQKVYTSEKGLVSLSLKIQKIEYSAGMLKIINEGQIVRRHQSKILRTGTNIKFI
jgi:hypothetical protein